ncbi:MAG: thioredoxin domain-containing protein, partial [Chlamydiia bacterium]|nr:thioredoxin domain-containing protein [Chlamydiia bacterium]
MQRFTNRLIKEKSPYLLQHAHNPVDWYPWGEEAFKAAHQKDCPIFLSIGYSTCHWCHVMERECFSNEHVAELLNENFINIKVDREELPEVDAVYMELAQTLMAGVTGWPLNIVLTPDLEPFYAATYLPPVPQAGLTSFPEMVDHVKSIWEEGDREEIDSQAKELVTIVNSLVQERGDDLPTADHPFVVATSYFKIADPVNGGVRGVPKFPIGYQIYYLFTYAATSKDGRATFLAERTLESLALGGIYDQLGGGFSRYAVDEEWKIPHFEKMLYD